MQIGILFSVPSVLSVVFRSSTLCLNALSIFTKVYIAQIPRAFDDVLIKDGLAPAFGHGLKPELSIGEELGRPLVGFQVAGGGVQYL